MENWSPSDWIAATLFVVTTNIGIVLWVRFFRQPLQTRSAAWLDHSVPVRWGLIDLLIVLFVWIASQAFTLQILMSIHGLEPGDSPGPATAARFGAIIGLVQLVVTGLIFARIGTRNQHEAEEFGLGAPQWMQGLKYGLAGFAMWIPLVWAIQTVLVYFVDYSHPSLERVSQTGDLRTLVDVWITAVVIAPIVEELLFRGVIQGWLQRWRSNQLADPNALILGGTSESVSAKKLPVLHVPAILLTSVLFGLAHYSQGPAPISLFVLSIGLGYLYQRTASLLACIVMHMLLNASTMLLYTVDTFYK